MEQNVVIRKKEMTQLKATREWEAGRMQVSLQQPTIFCGQNAKPSFLQALALSVLRLWWDGEPEADPWRRFVADDVELFLPVTPFSFLGRGKIAFERMSRHLSGLQSVTADAKSMRLLLETLGQQTPLSNMRLRMSVEILCYTVSPPNIMCQYRVKSDNAIMCGASDEVQMDGMFWATIAGRSGDLSPSECPSPAKKLKQFGNSDLTADEERQPRLCLTHARMEFDAFELYADFVKVFGRRIPSPAYTVDAAEGEDASSEPMILVSDLSTISAPNSLHEGLKVTFASESACCLLGMGAGELVGQSLASLVGDSGPVPQMCEGKSSTSSSSYLQQIRTIVNECAPAWVRVQFRDGADVFAAIYPLKTGRIARRTVSMGTMPVPLPPDPSLDSLEIRFLQWELYPVASSVQASLNTVLDAVRGAPYPFWSNFGWKCNLTNLPRRSYRSCEGLCRIVCADQMAKVMSCSVR
jgi:hypothetical protein